MKTLFKNQDFLKFCDSVNQLTDKKGIWLDGRENTNEVDLFFNTKREAKEEIYKLIGTSFLIKSIYQV